MVPARLALCCEISLPEFWDIPIEGVKGVNLLVAYLWQNRRIKDTKQKAASLHKQHQEHLEQLAEKQQRETEAKEQLERQWQENQQLKQQHERTK